MKKVLRKTQVKRIVDLVDVNFLNFIGKNLGSATLSDEDRSKLKKFGINVSSFEKEGVTEEMFKLGILSKNLTESQMSKMTLKQLREFLQKDGGVKLSVFEKEIVDRSKERVYDELKKVSLDFKKVLKDFYRGDFRREMMNDPENIKRTLLKYTLSAKDKKRLKELIKKELPNWTRRIDLIIDTLMHEIFTLGRVMYIVNSGSGSTDQKVYIRVFDGACSSCYKIYTENGKGSPSTIFKLNELFQNGNNHGLRRSDWLPVIPPTHPYCRCLIEKYVDGGVWDNSLNNYVLEINKK